MKNFFLATLPSFQRRWCCVGGYQPSLSQWRSLQLGLCTFPGSLTGAFLPQHHSPFPKSCLQEPHKDVLVCKRRKNPGSTLSLVAFGSCMNMLL